MNMGSKKEDAKGTTMEVEKVLHMNGGRGETSYAQNSSFQRRAREMVKHIIGEVIVDLHLSLTPQCMNIADLGCSSGPNALSLIEEIVGAINEGCLRMTMCHLRAEAQPTSLELLVFLNDLPTNDFNSIFMDLPGFISSNKLMRRGEGEEGRVSSSSLSSIFVAGVPGSFYGRLFPSNSLHFVHSSYSLHWLSQVPRALFDKDGKSINKGNICISATSPPMVSKAYEMQFQKDITVFLQSRSTELISGGRMVLIMLGRRNRDHADRSITFLWDLLAEALSKMMLKGEVVEERIDSYTLPFYAPCVEEMEIVVKKERSFSIDHIEIFEGGSNEVNAKNAKAVAAAIRAIQEPIIRHHFGEGIVDELFRIYGEILEIEMAKEDVKVFSLILVLRKIIRS